MAITKEKIILNVFEKTNLNRREAQQSVELLIELIKNTLAKDEDILISGFGKFMVKYKRTRRGRNPKTTKALLLKARKVVVFKTSGVLRERLNA